MHVIFSFQSYSDVSATANPLQTLQQRTWLIHWGLFVYFNHSKGRDLLIDHCLVSDPQYLNAIQTQCPHILRYLSVAVIANKRRRSNNMMKELVKIIEQESYAYRDPITDFISCLYIDYDFDGAQKKLKVAECLVTNLLVSIQLLICQWWLVIFLGRQEGGFV